MPVRCFLETLDKTVRLCKTIGMGGQQTRATGVDAPVQTDWLTEIIHMSTYKYTGLTSDRRKVSGDIEAPNKTEALRLLEPKGIFPTAIEQVAGTSANGPSHQPVAVSVPPTATDTEQGAVQGQRERIDTTKFTCSGCGRSIDIPSDMTDKTLKCPSCGDSRQVQHSPEDQKHNLMAACAAMGKAFDLQEVGESERAKKGFELAETWVREVLDLSGLPPSITAEANCLLGTCCKCVGRFAEARTFLEKGLALGRNTGFVLNEEWLYADTLGDVYDADIHLLITSGKQVQAKALLTQVESFVSCYKSCEKFESVRHEGYMLMARGMLAVHDRQPDAIAYFEKLLASPFKEWFTSNKTHNFVLALAYANVGSFHFPEAYRPKEAIPYFEEALKYCDTDDDSESRRVRELLAEAKSQAVVLLDQLPRVPPELEAKLESLRSGDDDTRLAILEQIPEDLPREYFRTVKNAIVQAMCEGDNRVRMRCAMLLVSLGDESYPPVNVLLTRLTPVPSKDAHKIKRFALYGLSYVKGRDDVVGKLIGVAEHDLDTMMRERAIFALAATQNVTAQQFVNGLATDGNDAAVFALDAATTDIKSLRDAILNGREILPSASMKLLSEGLDLFEKEHQDPETIIEKLKNTVQTSSSSVRDEITVRLAFAVACGRRYAKLKGPEAERLILESVEQIEKAARLDSRGGHGLIAQHMGSLSGYDIYCSFEADRIAEANGPDAAIDFLEEKLRLFAHVTGDPLIRILENLGEYYFNRNDDHRLKRQAEYCFRRVLLSQVTSDRTDAEETKDFAKKNLAIAIHFALGHLERQLAPNVESRSPEVLSVYALEQEAASVRKNSRMLEGVFLFLRGEVWSFKDEDRPPAEYPRYFTLSFKLGWLAVKAFDDVENMEKHDPEIGGYGGSYTATQTVHCGKVFFALDELMLKDEDIRFLAANPSASNTVRQISDLVLCDGEYSHDVIESTLSAIFIMGYIAAKSPENLPRYLTLLDSRLPESGSVSSIIATQSPVTKSDPFGTNDSVSNSGAKNADLLQGASVAPSGEGSLQVVSAASSGDPCNLPKILTLDLGLFSGLRRVIGSHVNLDLILIPSGRFVMGSSPAEEGRSDQERPLDVTISKPFYMGKFPVTQAQYEKIMGRNLSDMKGANNPADRVSWNDASEFCRRLSTLTGRTVRLPTMAEWEYACRAETATRFYTGNSASDLACAGWYKDNANGTTHPVGQKAPNRWGIYDMHGNVYEWCLDVWGGADYQSSGPVTDPVGLEQVDAYSVRGGCWGSDVNDCRSAGGMECDSGPQNNSIGFRVLVDPCGRKFASAETAGCAGNFAAKEHGNHGKARETVTMQSPLSPAEEETIVACAQERNGLIRKIIVNLLFLIPYIIVMFSSSGGGQPSKGAMWMLLPILIWGFIGFRWVLNAFTSVTGLVLFANLKSWGWMFFFGSVICSMFGGLIIPILIVFQSIKLYRLRGNSKAIGRLAIALPVASVAAVIIIPFVMHLTSQNGQGMSGRAVVGIPSETKTGESSGSRNAEAKRGIPLIPQSSTKTTRLGNRAHSGSREKVENRRPQIEPPVTPPLLAEAIAGATATPVAEARSLTDPRASSGLIAFVARNGKKREIFTMRPDGSYQNSLSSQLQDAFAPVWSLDGAQILFRGGGAGDFYVVESDGSNSRKVLDLAQVSPDFPGVQPFRLNAEGRWLPDGKTIAVCAGSWPDASHIYLVELPDLKRSTMPITGAAWQPAWSPDGTKIAFKTFSQATQKTHPFQIWLLDVKTSNQLPVSRECDIQAGPLWLPDGKRIVFIEHGGRSNGRQNNKLCMKNVENGEYTETDFSWDVAQIVVSSDGQNIAFSPRGSPIYLYQLAGNGWQQKAVIDNGGYPTWSPDGTSLAFVSSADHQIWLAHADGTGLVRIRPTSGQVSPRGTDTSGQPDSLDSAKERPEWSPINRAHAIADPSLPKLPSNFARLEKPVADGLHVDFPRSRDGASIKHQVTLPTGSARRNASDSNSDTSAIPTDETREMRTWAFKSRPPITASLVSESLGVVVLRKEDGSTSRFTEKYLSDADQNYVQAIRDSLLIGKSDKSEGK